MFICIGAVVFLVGYTIYQENKSPDTASNEDRLSAATQKIPSSSGTYAEQTDDTGPVSVTVKPLTLPATGEWKFAVSLQTHSVDLSMDLLESAVLVDSSGNEAKPISWDGDPPGGHHRTGMLSFEALEPMQETVTMLVKNIADVPVREFVWTK